MVNWDDEVLMEYLNAYLHGPEKSEDVFHNINSRLDETGREEVKYISPIKQDWDSLSIASSSNSINLKRNRQIMTSKVSDDKNFILNVKPMINNVIKTMSNSRFLRIKYTITDKTNKNNILRFATNKFNKSSNRYLQNKDIIEIALVLSMLHR